MPATLQPSEDVLQNPGLEVEAEAGEDVAPYQPVQASVFELPPSPQFTFLVHPERWDVILTEDGPEILPDVYAQKHTPGVGGVVQVEDEKGNLIGNPLKALAHKEQLGFIKVSSDIEVVAFEQKFKGYQHKFKGKAGSIHMHRWQRPYRVGRNAYIKKDEVGWHDFLRQLRDQLLGGAPDPAIVQMLEADLKDQLRRARSASRRSPGAAEGVEVLEEKLSVFRRQRLIEREEREGRKSRRAGGDE